LVEDFDGIVLYLENPNVGYSCLRMIRSIEPNRKIVCVLEDFDSLIKNYEEADFLSLFDGEKSVDHIVYIATTNYPEQIDRRFLDRPSRFDQVVTIRLPSLEDRLFYLKAKAPNVPLETLEMWAKETKDLAIAHLKEIIVSVTCFEYTFEDTMKRLREQKKLMNSEKMVGKKGVGFEG
jgi:SpoVK/Ycf46/Vps4 family AAA+-type ATPase